MAKGFIGASGCQAYLGAIKMRMGYIGAIRVYSAGNTVTYHVDAGLSYQEEVGVGESCLSPKTFTPSKSGWEFVGWRSDSTASGTVLISKVMGDDPVTLYAVFRQSVTVTYYNGSVTAGNTSEYKYYNNGNIVNPSFTLTQSALSGWTPAGWAIGNGSVAYSNGATFTRDSNITLYGMYQQTITVTYYNGSSTASKTSGTRYYYSGTGAVVNPVFTLYQAELSGWTARGWSTRTAGNGGISYNNGTSFTRDSNVTLYGMYYQSITLTYYNGSTTAEATSGVRYYNSGSDGIVDPTFSLTPATLSGWTFYGWGVSSVAGSGAAYSGISNTAFSSSATVYAMYYQTITLSYNGNGNTGGATNPQYGNRYWNTGNVSNPSFTLQANGFSKTNHIFSKWALGSASGTQYTAGASVTLSANTTMYAVWTGAAHYFTPLNSVTWTKTNDAWSWNNLIATDSYIKVQTKKSDATGSWGNIKASANIPTCECPKVRLKVSTSQYGLGRITIGGNSVDISADTAATYYYFDVSGSTINITIEATDGTAYFVATTTLEEIYFYN